MYLPLSTSNREKELIKSILENIVPEIKQFNPFARDFKQLRDLPAERFAEGKVVISAKHRPQGAHERVYNEFTNTGEISVLTDGNSNHNNIVICLNGVVQSIPERHRAAMPLRFTLLFPRGTYGWEEGSGQLDGTNRSQISPREFYNFHMMIREISYIRQEGCFKNGYVCLGYKQKITVSTIYVNIKKS